MSRPTILSWKGACRLVHVDEVISDSIGNSEIFGPFLPIVPVDTIEEAIEFVRDR
jgi:acyl-CoA reductase-like NAD-dependent aldehyde dehydrogenase